MHELIDFTPQVVQAIGPWIATAMGLQGAKSLFGLGQAISGRSKAKKLWKNAPQYDVEPPEYFNDILNMYNKQAPTRAPGSESAETRVDVGVAEAARKLEEMDDTRAILGSLGELETKAQAEKRAIAQRDAEYYAKRQRELESGRERVKTMGAQLETNLARERFGYEAQQWDMKMNEAMGMKKAGWGNIFSGLEGAANIGASYASNQALLNALNPRTPARDVGGKISTQTDWEIPEEYQPETQVLKDMPSY